MVITNQNEQNDNSSNGPSTPSEHLDNDGASAHAAQPADSTTPPDASRLAQELAEFKDKYVRVYAEMENIRRRHERERIELSKFALESVFKDFLPVLDSLEKALPDDDANKQRTTGAGANGSYYEGMLMVKRQLLDIFKKNGLETIRAAGVAFDPNVHQAIQRIESYEVDTETVGSEYARGYLLHGRLLRPAMVSVLTPAGG